MEIPYLQDNNSFLHARDPSILAWNRPALNPNIKMKLYEDSDSAVSSEETIDSIDLETLKVYLRIKPSLRNNNYKIIDNKTLECRAPSQIPNKNTFKVFKYSFSRIFGPETNQRELFDNCVKEKILNFINGQNSTLFTYGISGAGKTFTILGEENNPGIIPRALEYIFRTLPTMREVSNIKPLNPGNISVLTDEMTKDELKFKQKILNASSSSERSILERTYRNMQQRLSTDPVAELSGDFSHMKISVWISFSEIYNEHVYDLLKSEAPVQNKFGQKATCHRTKLPVGIDGDGKPFIKNLSSVCVSSGLEAYKVLQYGMHNLKYASTGINQHSSRSHCIFTIKLVQYNSTDGVQLSHYNFCDLAGSERVKNSHSVGERLKESSNINSSLHVLGRCIKAIRESQKNKDNRLIPFRESKLTRLFQPALTGHETMTMIVNLNPDQDMFDENQHVLNFSAIAGDVVYENICKPIKIELKQRISECMDRNSILLHNYSKEMSMEDQIEMLKEALLEQERCAQEKIDEIKLQHVLQMHQQVNDAARHHQKKIEEVKERLRERHEKQIKYMENEFKQRLENYINKPNDLSIIDLTDDVEQTDNEDFQLERESLLDKINQLEQELEIYRNKMNDLNKQLDMANTEYSKLEDEFFDQIKKNRDLQLQLENTKTELKILEEHYSYTAVMHQNQLDYADELEDRLNSTLGEMFDTDCT